MSSGRWANTPARIALLLQPVVTYFMKWRGVAGKAPAERRKWADMMFTCFIIVFVIWSLSFFSWRVFTEEVFAMSFVASAALIFGTPDAPNAQPRSVIGSHMLAAFIGNTIRICLIGMNGDVLYGSGSWWYPLFTGLSIGLTAFSMSALRIFHPPACSTAMLALQLSEELSPRVYGYAFMITPMFVGSATLCVFGMVFNNMFRSRNYPMYW
jgi:CBS-domain-containing membrane protein